MKKYITVLFEFLLFKVSDILVCMWELKIKYSTFTLDYLRWE